MVSLDWRQIDGFYPIAIAITGARIKVNGVTVQGKKGCFNYGRVYTGDIITVFDPEFGELGSNQGWGEEFLEFQCKFYVGPGSLRRATPFVIEEKIM